jgi:flagellar FliJ protein
MRKFRFTLQAPLEHAKYIEERLTLELGRLLERLYTEREKLHNYVRRRAEQQACLTRECEGALDLEQVRRRQRHIDALAEAVDRQKVVIAAAQQAVERKREELVAAMKRRKVLERLRERRAQEHSQEMQRLEQKLADEIAVSHYPRRNAETSSIGSGGR